MRSKRLFIRLRMVLAILAVTLFVTGTAASQERVRHNFRVKTGGAPIGSLIFDSAGNLYGTTQQGGAARCGTVFELIPAPGGGWTEKVLHNFHVTDGSRPESSLIFDAAGNLYGTTHWGGAHGYGTVFELSPAGGGRWTFKTLHDFNFNYYDGFGPTPGLVFDAAGNLYGTAGGGAYAYGIVFELSPTPGGIWTETIVHTFTWVDGAYPTAGLIIDAAGNLYGTTSQGGAHVYGTVFELTPTGDGTWTEIVLHDFIYDGLDGRQPFARLILNAAGNLYGTTVQGGYYGDGAVFELTPGGDGSWTATVLHSFQDDLFGGHDGQSPYLSGVVFDPAGNLYGTTTYGGLYNFGMAYKLMPTEDGSWTETILHSFNLDGRDGAYPFGDLIFDVSGNLYGTTRDGGTHGKGTVFEITP